MNGIDMTNAFIRGDDQNVVENERVRNGIGVADRDEYQAKDEYSRRSNVLIEQVHPLTQSEHGSHPLNTE